MIINLYKNNVIEHSYTITDGIINLFGDNSLGKGSAEILIKGNNVDIENGIEIYKSVKQCDKINLVLDNFSIDFSYDNAKLYVDDNSVGIIFIKEV